MNELGILKLDIEDPAQGSNRKHAQSLGSIVLCSLNCDTFSCAHKKNKLFEATKKTFYQCLPKCLISRLEHYENQHRISTTQQNTLIYSTHKNTKSNVFIYPSNTNANFVHTVFVA